MKVIYNKIPNMVEANNTPNGGIFYMKENSTKANIPARVFYTNRR
jgi:hypothetical protein